MEEFRFLTVQWKSARAKPEFSESCFVNSSPSGFVVLLSNISAEHRGLSEFLGTKFCHEGYFFCPVVSNSSLFIASFVFSVPLELIYNVLCHSLSFLDYILWNNLHNSLNLPKNMFCKKRVSITPCWTVKWRFFKCAWVKVAQTARG